MKPELYRLDDDKIFYEYAEKLTDRELQERQVCYIRQIERDTTRIKNNIVFFFYAFIASIVLSLIFVFSN